MQRGRLGRLELDFEQRETGPPFSVRYWRAEMLEGGGELRGVWATDETELPRSAPCILSASLCLFTRALPVVPPQVAPAGLVRWQGGVVRLGAAREPRPGRDALLGQAHRLGGIFQRRRRRSRVARRVPATSAVRALGGCVERPTLALVLALANNPLRPRARLLDRRRCRSCPPRGAGAPAAPCDGVDGALARGGGGGGEAGGGA